MTAKSTLPEDIQNIRELSGALLTVSKLISAMTTVCADAELEQTIRNIWSVACQRYTEEIVQLLEDMGESLDPYDKEFLLIVAASPPENIQKLSEFIEKFRV